MADINTKTLNDVIVEFKHRYKHSIDDLIPVDTRDMYNQIEEEGSYILRYKCNSKYVDDLMELLKESGYFAVVFDCIFDIIVEKKHFKELPSNSDSDDENGDYSRIQTHSEHSEERGEEHLGEEHLGEEHFEGEEYDSHQSDEIEHSEGGEHSEEGGENSENYEEEYFDENGSESADN